MISRVAGNCFWLDRYVERASSMARLLRVNRAFVPGIDLPARQQWYPLVIVSGEQKSLDEHRAGDDSEEGVQDYLTWDPRNSSSIYRSVFFARENARTAREVTSSEVWETLNAMWLWLDSSAGRSEYNNDRDKFYQHVQELAELLHGQADETMLDAEPLAFMRLARFTERAGQTARLMDVQYHTFPDEPESDSPVRFAQWMALLAGCSAMEPFKKCSAGAPTARGVVNFLLFEPTLPRSIVKSLLSAQAALEAVRSYGDHKSGKVTAVLLDTLVRHLQMRSHELVMGSRLHEELTFVVDSLGDIGRSIENEFFLANDAVAEAAVAASQ